MDKATQTMIDNLNKNTGKTLEEWIKVVKNSGIEKHKEIIDFLKSEHKLTYGFANFIALKSRGTDSGSAENPESLVDHQYKDKESLLPIFKKLIEEIKKFGTDVEIAPKNAYVSLRRKKQFALIQPSTKDRVDLGLNIKDKDFTDRLEKSGSFNAMCTHRVRLESVEQVDSAVIDWVKDAYNQAG